MKILAFEFSSSRRSVAALNPLAPGGPIVCEEVEDDSTRSTHPFRLVESALGKAGMEREDVECLVVGLGPGSYHGVRMSIAIAQGWQLARATRILGMSAADCLARQAWELKLRGRIHVAIDAQRGEFYLAGYDVADNAAVVAESLRLARQEEVQLKIATDEVVIGPELDRLFAGARSIFPSAATLATLGNVRNDYVPGHQLEPLYLRETAFVKAPAPRTIPPV